MKQKEKISFCLVNSRFDLLEKESYSYLSREENDIFTQYSYFLKKYNYLLGRYAAKKAITNFQNNIDNETQYTIFNGLMGEPIIDRSCLHVSISHSESYGVAVVAKDPYFSVDIESFYHLIPVSLDLLDEEEVLVIKNVYHSINDHESRVILWSVKEALVKYLKIGLSLSFHILTIDSVCLKDKNIIEVKFKNFSCLRVWGLKFSNFVISLCSLKFFYLDFHHLFFSLEE